MLEAVAALEGQGHYAQALRICRALMLSFPADERVAAAIDRLTRGLAAGTSAEPADPAKEHFGEAVRLQGGGWLGEAADRYRQALAIRPDYVEAHNNLGSTLRAQGRLDEALACYERALRLRPGHPNIYNNLGVTLKALGRNEEAIGCYQRALAARPDFADAHYNLGNALQAEGRLDAAIASFERAVALRPDHAEGHSNLAAALVAIGRIDAAIVSYERALQLRPELSDARAQTLFLKSLYCDWDAIDAQADLIPMLGITGDAIAPYAALTLEDHPERHRIRAERFAADRFRQVPLPAPARPTARPERLRIGYFSADFKNHPVGRLIARTLELHDRTRFEVHGYAYGDAASGPLRDRLAAACDVFREVDPLSDRAIAELARRDGIDIAVDLTGYTGASRSAIFAYRPAPVQVNYLGLPGTSGAPFLDYLVADKGLIPQQCRGFYSEAIIYLPDQYQAQDDSLPFPDAPPSRTSLGLPEQGFVFCAINNSYKIKPAEFTIWMRLLQEVEGSVLWLLRASAAAEANLRRAAERRGVDPDRIRFAGKVAYEEYVARFAQADLFLDTFISTAGATASDALRAGLPVLTKAGRGYTARMAASLVSAVGLPEMVVDSEADYERLALDLARDPARLKLIRERLSANRHSMPLFDSARFTRHLEDGFARAYDDFLAGKSKADIEISAGSRADR